MLLLEYPYEIYLNCAIELKFEEGEVIIMMDVGGTALRNGIIFISEHKKAIGTVDKDGNFNIQVKNLAVETYPLLDDIEYYIYKIPFIRGIYELMSNVVMIISISILGIAFLLVNYNKKINLGTNSDSYILATEIVLTIIMILILVKELMKIYKNIIKLKALYSFHGAEHKVINTFNDNRELSIDEVKKSSRVSNRCGSILVIFWIFLVIIGLAFFRCNYLISSIASYSIAYEIFYIENGEKLFFISLFYKLANILQEKVVTREPDEKQLELAILTFKEIEKAELEFDVENYELEIEV